MRLPKSTKPSTVFLRESALTVHFSLLDKLPIWDSMTTWTSMWLLGRACGGNAQQCSARRLLSIEPWPTELWDEAWNQMLSTVVPALGHAHYSRHNMSDSVALRWIPPNTQIPKMSLKTTFTVGYNIKCARYVEWMSSCMLTYWTLMTLRALYILYQTPVPLSLSTLCFKI